MPSTSKNLQTVVLPLPMPPVIPTFSMSEDLGRCAYYVRADLFAFGSSQFHRNCRALDSDESSAGNFQLQRAIVVHVGDASVDAGGGHDLLTAANGLAEFLLLFRAFGLWANHE